MRKIFYMSLFFLLFSSVSFAQDLTSKKVVLIIPQNDFQDEEFSQVKTVLSNKGATVKVASTTTDFVTGMYGDRVKPDLLIDDLYARDFDAVVLIGGMGASQYWNDSRVFRVVQDADSQNLIIGAICIAPVTLANAGILRGKRATVSSSDEDELVAGGAIYSTDPVVRDGNIITASGPVAANDFAEEISRALNR
ncbi:MAG: DJ-1/PfpI family protein [Candidatus Omnitrophica bacterium]|nr:DJ-1/PfpI family protein [Candidatus Omnitrophota bacterium]